MNYQPHMGLRIIVIDDNLDWCNTIKRMIKMINDSQKSPGREHRLDVALSVEEGINRINEAERYKDHYAIAIVDRNFKEGDDNVVAGGLDLIDDIKRNYPYIACVVASAEHVLPDEVLDLRDQNQLDYYLQKDRINRAKLQKAIDRSASRLGELWSKHFQAAPSAPPQISPAAYSSGAEAHLRLTFSSLGDVTRVRWEADVLEVRDSSFISPYRDADLALVVRVLDQLQHQSAGLSTDDADRLTALKIPHQSGIIAPLAYQTIGQQLFAALVADPAAAMALGTVRSHVTSLGQSLAVHLHFPSNTIPLAALPWELLWDAGPMPMLLGQTPQISLSRHLDVGQPIGPPRPGGQPLRVLAVAPKAKRTEFDSAAEQNARRAAWNPLVERGQVVLMPDVSPATPAAIADALRTYGPIDVLHFVGHGVFAKGEGHLILDTPDGDWNPTAVQRLAPILASVRLVVLTACEGAAVGVGDEQAYGMLSGVAPALSAAGVPLVIAMQYTVRTSSANRFTSILYSELAAGKSIQEAVSVARRTLFLEEQYGTSWYVPALYVRARDAGPVYVVN